jgi:hypothetical protein
MAVFFFWEGGGERVINLTHRLPDSGTCQGLPTFPAFPAVVADYYPLFSPPEVQ